MPGTLASLLIKLGLDATGVEQGVARAEKSIGGLSSGAGTAMKVAGTLIGGGLGLAAKGALEMEDRAARFQADTGASADEARHFADVVNAAAGSSLVSMDDIATSATRIRTDLGLTGDAADASLDSFLRYERATGQGADAVLAFDDILDAWNLTAADTGAVMDTLIAGQQAYGGSIADSQDVLAKLAPVLQGANMDWQQGTELINLFNAAGVDATAGVTGMTKALGKVQSPDELQALLVDIATTVDPFERAQKAIDVFGAKAGPKLAQALQTSGGDLSRFGFELTQVQGKTEDAAAALDDTLTSKVKLAVNGALSLLRGFGMQVGPVLTGAVSAISFGKSLGLDRAIGPLFRGLGSRAGQAFSSALAGAVGVADRLFGPLASKLGAGAESLGTLAGGKFGMAFKAAAGVGLALVIADELAQAGEMRQKNIEAAAGIDDSMKQLLADAPTRAEAEQKLAALKAIPEQLDGVQGAIYGFADFARGNVLGSAVDGLFGANPAQVNEEQIKALEAYLAQLPADTAAVASQAGAGVVANVAAGAAKAAGQAFDGAGQATGAAAAGATVGARYADGISEGITSNVGSIQTAWGAVGTALAKGPKLESYKHRLGDFRTATETVLRRMRAAVKANDPVAASYYVQQYRDIRTAQSQFRQSAQTVWGDVATIIDGSTANAGADVAALADTVGDGAVQAQLRMQRSARNAGHAFPAALQMAVAPTSSAAADVADAATGPLSSVPPKAATWGDHAGDRFASNLYATAPQSATAASHIAAQVSRYIAFSHPPRVGPLSGIRSWGPHLVGEWLGPMERHVGDVERTAGRLAGAMTPRPGMPTWDSPASTATHAWGRPDVAGRGSAGGGEVHIHVGTLIANDAGIDELQRRMSGRHRIRKRDRGRAGSPNGMDRG